MPTAQELTQSMRGQFGCPPSFIVRSPGRVNLIGEHTDYNDGFVLPMAIDRSIWIALRPAAEGLVEMHAADLEERGSFALDSLRREGTGWIEYAKGVAWSLQEAGHDLTGWSGVLAGDLPVGAGLASSAALELAASRAFAAASEIDWDPPAMAEIAQRAEREWVGVECGIMDQLASACGVADHALLIDCRTREVHAEPLPPDTAVVILDTTVRRDLTDTAYNDRRAQCQEAAREIGVRALRDIDLMDFRERASGLTGTLLRRARHVVTENARVLHAVLAMRSGNAELLGRLMDASHSSLRDDYEVSSPELDAITACAREQEGCFGARMTGAGFGGCAVALVSTAAVPRFLADIARSYASATGLESDIWVCRASAGTAVEDVLGSGYGISS